MAITPLPSHLELNQPAPIGTAKDMTGMKISCWKFIHYLGGGKWLCRCDCGVEKPVFGYTIRNGSSRSCSTCRKLRVKTFQSKKGKYRCSNWGRIYNIWWKMNNRCTNAKDIRFHIYGGKGVSVCQDWRDSVASFYEWAMANGYKKDLTIDRINSDGDYAPSNCRWATRIEQSHNLSTNIIVSYRGESRRLCQLAMAHGIDQKVAYGRYALGWDIERILTQPIKRRKAPTTNEGSAG